MVHQSRSQVKVARFQGFLTSWSVLMNNLSGIKSCGCFTWKLSQADHKVCGMPICSMYVRCQSSSYILKKYLWKHGLKSLNYVSGQMLCLLTPHYTHSPLSHFCGRGTVNASRSFSQEWLTFRKTVRKNRWWGEAWGRKRRPTFWQMNHRPKCRSDNTTKKRNVEEEDRKPHKRQWTWTRYDHDWNKLCQPMR